MQHKELERLESDLALVVPSAYRATITAFPVTALRGNSDAVVWDDAAALVQLNRRLRVEESWDSRSFAIGRASGDPSVWFVDLDSETVLWADHGYLPSSRVGGEPLKTWLDSRLRALAEELEAEGVSPDSSPTERSALERARGRSELLLLAGCASLVALGIVLVFGVLLS